MSLKNLFVFVRVKINISKESKHVSPVNLTNRDQNFATHNPSIACDEFKIMFSDTTLNKVAAS